jgi:monofunctional glycosyltransferase
MRRLLRWTLIAASAFYTLIVVVLILLRWMRPPFTAVQIERRVHAWTEHSPYKERYAFVSLAGISPYLQHAVIAAEDARFFRHHGFDWREIGSAIEQDVENGRTRGASTITQQLVRNLFLTTNRSIVRKGIELSIVPLTEGILSKRRILELYLNVIEWGPGIYVAEPAARYYYDLPAQHLTREQAVQLAAILPSPLNRKPGHVAAYASRIQQRMHEMDW